MTRRLLLLLPLAACLRADSGKEVEELVTSAATGLSSGRPELFFEAFDLPEAERDKMRTWILGLNDRAALTCSIEVLKNEGDDTTRTLTLDWILRIDPKDGNVGFARREKTVTCEIRKRGKNWRIVSFEPLDLFAPLA